MTNTKQYLSIIFILMVSILIVTLLLIRPQNGKTEITEPYSTNDSVINDFLHIEIPYDNDTFSVTKNASYPMADSDVPNIEMGSDDATIRIYRYTGTDMFFDTGYYTTDVPTGGVTALTRFDRAGYAGQRQWYWHTEVHGKPSTIAYVFHRGDNVLKIDADIASIHQPQEKSFRRITKHIDNMVSHIHFLDGAHASREKSVHFTSDISIDAQVFDRIKQ